MNTIPLILEEKQVPRTQLLNLPTATPGTAFIYASRDGKVEDQVTGSDELSRMVQGLEERYDAYMAGSTLATPMIHTGDLPSADELAAELERFLANRPTGDDEKRGA